MIAIHAVDVAAGLPEEWYAQFMQVLPADRQKRISAFLRREDAVRALTAQLLLRIELMRALGLTNQELHFCTNRYGKPALQSPALLHFNLSHAGDWVVLAMDDTPVGIDVERIKAIDLDIAKRFFAAAEYADLLARPAAERRDYFFTLWTLKESYIKAIGMGLSLPLDSFAVKSTASGIRLTTEGDAAWHFREYPLAPGYKLAVCARHEHFPPAIEHRTLERLYYDFVALNDSWQAAP